MQWLRFRAVFPWRIALLLTLLPTIPLLIFGGMVQVGTSTA